ncbi:MAG TPA: hypothetical protein VN903_12555 [Polyangia bacterium]|nr:hypothetical protein [Polyangia bacterium]
MPATTPPPQTCLLNWGRLNATRLNYLSTQLYGSIGGVPLNPTTQAILIDSLSISDRLNEEPNTLVATIRGTKPREGQGITLTYGSLNATPLFAGTILRVTQVWAADNPKNLLYHVEATDPTWRLNEVLVTARYRTQSASTIGADLLARFAPAGYVGAIESQLPTLDEITFTNTKLMDAFVQLANRIGGYTFCDYRSTVHLFRTGDAVVPPAPLVATHPSVSHVTYTRDLTQMVTRAIVQGGGANALARIPPGSTEIPVEDATWYNPSGGLVVSGPQRIAYTGTRAGGGGALVGSGAAPSSAPALAAAPGGAVTVGGHYYAYTWVSAAGETVPSPIGAIILDWSTPAGIGPDLSLDPGPGLVTPGTYRYGSTTVTANGESAVAGDVAVACTVTQPSPLAPPTVEPNPGYETNIAGARDRVIFRVAYRSTTGVSPAVFGPWSAEYTLPDIMSNESMFVTIPPVTSTGGAIYCDLSYHTSTDTIERTIRVNMPVPVAPAGGMRLTMGIEHTQPNPAVDTGGFPVARVTVIVKDGGAGVTARRVYRTTKDGTQKYLLREVAGSAQTQFLDTTADSALVTPAPPGILLQQTVQVSGIALGPKGAGGGAVTTARRLYRSAASVAPLQLLATLADNTTTTYTDTAADAALGAAPPATDTSGLIADGGQVLAGATTLPVSGTGPFPSAGGWVLAGNNRIHYAGTSALALTGIPATGDGAIANTIPYSTPVTLAPSLTGIPASGTGAIVWAILAGDPVDLLVIVDDLNAQAVLQTLLGGSATGIREALLQDGRIGIPEATARGQALLKLQSAVLESLTHRARDPQTVAGALVSVNLPAPTGIVGTYRIQDVTVSSFHPAAGIYPTYDAHSSSSRYTLEDLLRQLSRTDPPPPTGETP